MGVEQVEAVLGAGHAHIRESPLLLQLALVLQRAAVWQQPLLEADHEHDRELEPLGGVQRDQRHAIRPVLQGVLVGDQRHLLEEAGKSLRRRDLVELRGVVAQLGHIGPAVGALIGPVVDGAFETAALQRCVEDRAGRFAARHLHERTHERREAGQ